MKPEMKVTVQDFVLSDEGDFYEFELLVEMYNEAWSVRRRYSEFLAVHSDLLPVIRR